MATRRRTPDQWTTDRLVAGRLVADDAPPGYRRVAALLSAAGSRPEAEPVGPGAISSLVAAIHQELESQTPRRSPMFSKALAAKALAALSVLSLSAAAGAAATGNLPHSVQNTVADAEIGRASCRERV
jgi:hypothetical protein